MTACKCLFKLFRCLCVTILIFLFCSHDLTTRFVWNVLFNKFDHIFDLNFNAFTFYFFFIPVQKNEFYLFFIFILTFHVVSIFLEYLQCLLSVKISLILGQYDMKLVRKFLFFKLLCQINAMEVFLLRVFYIKLSAFILLVFKFFNHPQLPNIVADSNWDPNFL